MMISRFIDPNEMDVDEIENCEHSLAYQGERVKGVEIRGFELVTTNPKRDGIELLLSGSIENIGIVVKADCSEESASALEALIGEVVNRLKGVEYLNRKENVVLRVEKLNTGTFECIAQIIYFSFKKIVDRVEVILILDRDEFVRMLNVAREIHRKREVFSREEDVEEFYICKSCQHYLPYNACVISPERPSPCGTTWIEAKTANELGIVGYYQPVKKGKKINSEYAGINKIMEEITEGRVKRVSLHAVLKNPPLSGLYPQIIIFYDPSRDAFGIVDRDYREKTPIGLKFSEMEKLISGQQVEGFVGASFSYLKSPKFLADEGGWKRIYWMSPNVKAYVERGLKTAEK
ncbi:hypothetical protein Asulf_02202 [Archaeoglobus sulfaticallidus PM70-1]|uniref:CO-methylating acetyl-CoA synthase n=1 Tax=Archaeoglobus sulfaticallidus PM70-1 TaxID=387631 RepID=N0BP77_9EURY|nr:hypothetical protein [Archaeoglobus sulfaticallidus]AGK62155.1 hypothetical protein Asulf_02202 [Archaeoglobus sulfaticallidus PM70-1]